MTRIARGARLFQWRRQRQEKARRWPVLNLVALMDVFTILVFFFLAHSSDAESVSADSLVRLPESSVSQRPRETPVVVITPEQILLQGKPLIAVDKVLKSGAIEIAELRAALQQRPGRQRQGESAAADREITIMGDRVIPFTLLNRVMVTCNRAGYGRISLSVVQKTPGSV